MYCIFFFIIIFFIFYYFFWQVLYLFYHTCVPFPKAYIMFPFFTSHNRYMILKNYTTYVHASTPATVSTHVAPKLQKARKEKKTQTRIF